jgi:hypothetical protein
MPDPVVPSDLDLGHVVEGVVEIDPMNNGHMVIRTETRTGDFVYFDVQEALAAYEGEQVRFIIVPQRTINRVAELVEQGSVPVEQVPSAGKR